MVIAVYEPGVPTGIVDLDQDYRNLQNNAGALDTIFGIDHTLFSNQTAQQGYHTSIHSIPQSTPTNVPGFAQIYTTTTDDGIDTDQQLFYQTGTGNHDVAMTRNFLPAVGDNVLFPNNGYTFLPGGFILQWGTWPVRSTTYSVVFANDGGIAFPTACYMAQATFGTTSTTNSPTITAKGPTGITITWASGNSSNGYWMAIGI